MQCFRKFPVAKKFMDKGGGKEEVSKFCVEFFCLNSAESFLKEPSELLNLSFLLELYIFCGCSFVPPLVDLVHAFVGVVEQYRKRLEKLLSDSLLWSFLRLLFKILQLHWS